MEVRPGLPRSWGATKKECARSYPCDAHLDAPDQALIRAVDVCAEPAVVFRWLCQLRAAPYSYDWIDNFGRRSPRVLTPGLEQLALGQPFMRIFELVAFEPERHVTLLLRDRRGLAMFGEIACSYVVEPGSPSRIVAKMIVRRPRGPWRWLAWALGWGDLVMMRKQLLTLKRCAERQRP